MAASADAGRDAEAHGFVAVDHPAGERELLRHVEADDPREQLGAGHVRDQAPPHLEHRHLHVGSDDPDVRAERDLEPAAERDTVDRRDDRRRDLLPHERRLLARIGDLPASAGRHVLEVATAVTLPSAWNDPKSRPAQNARPSPESTTARTAGSDFSASLSRRAPRRAFSSRVHLLRPIHPHVSDAVHDAAGHSDQTCSRVWHAPVP